MGRDRTGLGDDFLEVVRVNDAGSRPSSIHHELDPDAYLAVADDDGRYAAIGLEHGQIAVGAGAWPVPDLIADCEVFRFSHMVKRVHGYDILRTTTGRTFCGRNLESVVWTVDERKVTCARCSSRTVRGAIAAARAAGKTPTT